MYLDIPASALCDSRLAMSNGDESLKRQSRLQQTTFMNFFFIFRENMTMFQVNPPLGRGFTGNIKPYFVRKIKGKN